MSNKRKNSTDNEVNNDSLNSFSGNGQDGNGKKRKLIKDIIGNQTNNRYEISAEAPFLVYLVDKREEYNLGNIHPMVIGKHFRLNKISLNSIDKVDEQRFSLIFNSRLRTPIILLIRKSKILI